MPKEKPKIIMVGIIFILSEYFVGPSTGNFDAGIDDTGKATTSAGPWFLSNPNIHES